MADTGDAARARLAEQLAEPIAKWREWPTDIAHAAIAAMGLKVERRVVASDGRRWWNVPPVMIDDAWRYASRMDEMLPHESPHFVEERLTFATDWERNEGRR